MPTIMKLISRSIEDTDVIATHFVAALQDRKSHDWNFSGATVIGLSGDLGAGKTTFMKSVAQALGVRATVTSPTFVIEKRYPLRGTTFSKLVHIDAYRLRNGQDLLLLDWTTTSADPRTIIFIEWPEVVSDVLPIHTILIRFETLDEAGRSISTDVPGLLGSK
jgi:tRNA threonylcarbamoyladenosine biosynthesis protein TsaE